MIQKVELHLYYFTAIVNYLTNVYMGFSMANSELFLFLKGDEQAYLTIEAG